MTNRDDQEGDAEKAETGGNELELPDLDEADFESIPSAASSPETDIPIDVDATELDEVDADIIDISDAEVQQAQIPVIFLIITPIMFLTPVIEDPSSTLSVALSLFPFFSPILMWPRVVASAVPAWQIALSFVLIVGMVFAVAWLAGRIYKVGMLMTGKRPTLPELLRWVREA